MAQASSLAEGTGLHVAQLQETLFALKLSLRGGRILSGCGRRTSTLCTKQLPLAPAPLPHQHPPAQGLSRLCERHPLELSSAQTNPERGHLRAPASVLRGLVFPGVHLA